MITERIGSVILIAGLVVAGAATTALAADDGHADRVRLLVKQGKGAEALAAAVIALEYAPEDPALLDLASRAAQAAGKPDESMWYAKLGLESLAAEDETPAGLALTEELEKRLAQLDPLLEETDALLEAYAAQLLEVCKKIQRKKLYANTVDLLLNLEGTTHSKAAADLLDKLYKNPKSAEAILESGIDVPIRSEEEAGDESYQDKKHSKWDNAWEFKGKNYTVVTNMKRKMGLAVLNAMDQMNRFYRKVFQHKTKGGGTARSVIRVHRDKREFMKMHDVSASVGGFFMPGDKSVTTYDPRSAGEPLTDLWEVLFHEASHQFADMIAAGEWPGWLNEGTACYFEGARILPSGIVQTNLIPDRRLKVLPAILRSGQPALRDVVSFFQGGSYPGAYYPVGWGLVYYMLNYENEKSERIYVPLYQKYMRTYRTGGKHDVVGRFEEYFVKKAKVPGVTTFEEFEAKFAAWIGELHTLHYGGPEQADKLIARARSQRDNGKPEYAVESYQWALRKRPGDALAYFELGQVYESLKKEKWSKDAAIFSYRRALEIARAEPDPKATLPGFDGIDAGGVMARCNERIQKLESTLPKTLGPAEQSLVDGMTRLAATYVEKGRPRRAVDLLGEAVGMLGGHGPLQNQLDEIRTQTGVDTRRWRRLITGDGDLGRWQGSDEMWTPSQGGLTVKTEVTGLIRYDLELPDAYRYETRINTMNTDEDGIAGMIFGSNLGGEQILVVLVERGIVALMKLEDGAPRIEKPLGKFNAADLDDFLLAIEVDEKGHVEFFVDDRNIGSHDYTPLDVRGRVGLLGGEGQGTVEYRDMRVFY